MLLRKELFPNYRLLFHTYLNIFQQIFFFAYSSFWDFAWKEWNQESESTGKFMCCQVTNDHRLSISHTDSVPCTREGLRNGEILVSKMFNFQSEAHQLLDFGDAKEQDVSDR